MFFESATRTVFSRTITKRGDNIHQIPYEKKWGTELLLLLFFQFDTSCHWFFFYDASITHKDHNIIFVFQHTFDKRYHSAVFSLPEAKLLSYFELVPHDHILDIPNGILGIIYYTYIFVRFILSHDNPSSAILRTLFTPYLNMIISTLAMASSLFLGRKLFILQEICVVCITTHAVNTVLFYRSIMEIIRGGKVKND